MQRVVTNLLLGGALSGLVLTLVSPMAEAAAYPEVAVQPGATACKDKNPPPEPGPDEGTEGQVVKKGPILVVRGMRRAEPQITDEQGKRFLLTGPWRRELLRLHGHTVQVWGELGAKKLMQRTVKVARYEIVDSGGGRKPLVGLLGRGEDGRLTLRQKERVLPLEISKPLYRRLVKRLGCKVWIVGDVVAGELKVGKFGWLSCPSRPSIKSKKEAQR